jgi:hypothetical protein
VLVVQATSVANDIALLRGVHWLGMQFGIVPLRSKQVDFLLFVLSACKGGICFKISCLFYPNKLFGLQLGWID